MTSTACSRCGSAIGAKMALVAVVLALTGAASGAGSGAERTLTNITRYATGDLFSLVGSDCGPTRCMEVSHGTALSALGGDACVCQCRRDAPAFREDQKVCVNHVEECLMASFGRGATKPQIPFVFLPLKGQIIYPSKEIVFTDVEDAICAVTSAQYLSPSGWVTLRDLLDNDVPFSLYRDEGSTFLQWRGSAALHARLEGRLVAVHVLCSAPAPARLAASCAAFRIAGASYNSLLDVRSIPFHAGEIVTSEPATLSQGLSVLESLAIGVCVLMLIFVYAAGIIFYVHYKQRQKRKEKDPEMNNTLSTDNDSNLGSRIDLDNVTLKTNPLLKLDSLGADFLHDAGLSDVSEHTEETTDSTSTHHTQNQKLQMLNSSVISAMVHTRHRKKPPRPSIKATSTPERLTERFQRRSTSPDIERAPHSDLAIVDCSMDNSMAERHSSPQSNGETVIRKKLYFNPVFFETEHLKDPPPAAVEFLIKIREVMNIAKEKMTTKRFIPTLSDIPEEESYHSIDLGWDIPCARRGRRFSAISLKRENSRRAVHCGGCPGCDSREPIQKPNLTRSNSCKTCISEDYKQHIVRKWLDEVPPPKIVAVRPIKSIAKVSGTPRTIEPKLKDESRVSSPDLATDDDMKSQKSNESTLKKKLRALRSKESPSKKSIKTEKPIIIHNVPLDREFEMIEEPLKTHMKTIEIQKMPQSPSKSKVQASVITVHEKKSPSSHASRRIRKKLPPPPPPPSIPPKAPNSAKEDEPPIPPEVKVKMEAVIKELNKCRRVEPIAPQEIKIETVTPIAPKLVIPVLAAEPHYFSDDNTLNVRKKSTFVQREPFVEFDSIERNILKKRRFSLACGPELNQMAQLGNLQDMQTVKNTLTRSWRDIRNTADNSYHRDPVSVRPVTVNHSGQISEISVNSGEPLYDNIATAGPLTIQVRGSPVENRRNDGDEFDPDTLDRKPRQEVDRRVEKILLKSGGSFKHQTSNGNIGMLRHPEQDLIRKIGSLREIYESKAKHEEDIRKPSYERRGSLPYGSRELAAVLVKSVKTSDLIRQIEAQKEFKPPIPPKQRRFTDLTEKLFPNSSPPGEKRRSPEERERYQQYLRGENLNARRSGRRSNRTRSRRTDLRKLYRTEDSGYLSTDSNESKRRASYLMQLKPKSMPEQTSQSPAPTVIRTPILQHIESDTDDMESICDGRSESGGESIETDSVFFGNFDESKQLLAELNYEMRQKLSHHEQIDSGFMGETNIILSGDSDSEHRSVISIVTGRDGRSSKPSIAKLDEPPYVHSVEC